MNRVINRVINIKKLGLLLSAVIICSVYAPVINAMQKPLSVKEKIKKQEEEIRRKKDEKEREGKKVIKPITEKDKKKPDPKKSDNDKKKPDPKKSDNDKKKPVVRRPAPKPPVVGKNKVKNKFGQKECPICFEEFKENDDVIKISSCKHIYHRNCLDGWLTGINEITVEAWLTGSEEEGLPDKHNTCPICSRPVLKNFSEETINELISKYTIKLINKNENNNRPFRNKVILKVAKKLDVMALKELIKKGVDVNVVGDRGYTPLHFVARGANANDQTAFEAAKLLVANKANVMAKHAAGLEPIDLVWDVNSELSKYLHQEREKCYLKMINEKPRDTELMKTILKDASRNAYVQSLTKLMGGIINVNTEFDVHFDFYGGTGTGRSTALHEAVYKIMNSRRLADPQFRAKLFDVIKLLVERWGANLYATNYENLRPIDLAERGSDVYNYLARKMGLPEVRPVVEEQPQEEPQEEPQVQPQEEPEQLQQQEQQQSRIVVTTEGEFITQRRSNATGEWHDLQERLFITDDERRVRQNGRIIRFVRIMGEAQMILQRQNDATGGWEDSN